MAARRDGGSGLPQGGEVAPHRCDAHPKGFGEIADTRCPTLVGGLDAEPGHPGATSLPGVGERRVAGLTHRPTHLDHVVVAKGPPDRLAGSNVRLRRIACSRIRRAA